jgi:hypothetical protein
MCVAHQHDPNVLFLTYEELSRDLEGAIGRIAAFIGREPSATELPRIVERCRFAFMKQHEEQFDPVVESLWEQGVQLNSFLRNGRVGAGAVFLSKGQNARFEEALRNEWGLAGVPSDMSTPSRDFSERSPCRPAGGTCSSLVSSPIA